MDNKQRFLKYIGQTSSAPLLLEFERAEGIYMFTPYGKRYIDFVSGVSVNNVGHGNAKVLEAVMEQVKRHLHLNVYGEYIQSSQLDYAESLVNHLPEKLNNVYFVNTGSEAIEGAMKLAKRYTGRPEFISFNNAYHGGTQGALSLYGNEYFKSAFRPLLPQIKFCQFNCEEDLSRINEHTAAVIVEPIQSEAGIIHPKDDFLKKLRNKCTETGTLLIFDEVQVGMGRTGSMFAFERFGVVPDILVLAKAFGGGMPLGAFISHKSIMDVLQDKPILGHITTFGGHPVSCAAGLAAFKYIQDEDLHEKANAKGLIYREILKHPLIKYIRGTGLFLAIEFEDAKIADKFFDLCIENYIAGDKFLFSQTAFRIAPPLTISEKECEDTAKLLLSILDTV